MALNILVRLYFFFEEEVVAPTVFFVVPLEGRPLAGFVTGVFAGVFAGVLTGVFEGGGADENAFL